MRIILHLYSRYADLGELIHVSTDAYPFFICRIVMIDTDAIICIMSFVYLSLSWLAHLSSGIQSTSASVRVLLIVFVRGARL